MSSQNELKDKSIGYLLIKYSIPSILAMMITSLYNTVDRIFVGSIKDVGSLAISGIGVTMPFITILGAFCVAIAVGGSTNIAIKLGENKKEEAEKVLGTTILLEVIVALILYIVCFFFIEDILYLFGASESTIRYSLDYINIIVMGAIYNLPGFAMNNAIRAQGNPKFAGNMMIICCILNIILDPILIFGFNMGIKGAALGTIICQFIVFAWSLHYFTLGKSSIKLKLKNIKIEFKVLKAITLIALTPFFMELASGFIHLLTNNILKSYGGDLTIGAMTVITSISLLFLMPVYGISQGMQTIIAYNYGAKLYNRSRKTLSMAIIYSGVFLIFGVLIILLFKNQLIEVFTKDKNLQNIASNGISIYLCMLPTIGVSVLGTVYFQSIGKAKLSMILSLLRQVIIFIPFILTLPKMFGLTGVWASQPTADLLSMVIVVLFLIKDFKKDDYNLNN